MVDISRETYESNGVETIVDSNGILWLNERHIKDRLDHKNLWMTTGKYISDHKKYRYQLVDKPKKQLNRIFTDKELAVKVIMDRRTTVAHKFRTRL